MLEKVLLLLSAMALCRGFSLNRIPTGANSISRKLFSSSGYAEAERFSLSVTASTSYEFTGDLLVVPFFKPKVDKKDDKALTAALLDAIPKSIKPDVVSLITEIIEEGNFKGDAMSKQLARVSSSFGTKYIAIVGLGAEKTPGDSKDMDVSSALKFGKVVGSISKEIKSKSSGIAMPSHIGNAGLTQFFVGFHDAVHIDRRYKSNSDDKQKPYLSNDLSLLGCSESIAKDAVLTHKLTSKIVSGVEFAKDLVNAPANAKTPLAIADEARKIATENNLEIKVLGLEECTKLGMGGYLGVQQGSMFPPQFIHMTYKPENIDPNTTVKVALIGKGLTFDSGGYNLKAGAGSMIEMMKFDMGGCAAVLGSAKAIGALKPKNVEVHWISAVCENMISAEAMRPGDILVASNGKTIEVGNTDAEGRLTLADALVYADRLNVDIIIDLATLTGACMVALGDKVAGLYSPDNQLRTDIEKAAQRTEEGIWSMPLEPAYKDYIKSSIADLKNVGGRYGGSITAALFLQDFVEKAKWAHIDMAGPVWDNKENKPTGYGVKLLVDYILNVKKV